MSTTFLSEIITQFPRYSENSSANGMPPTSQRINRADAAKWKQCIDELLGIRLLESDWDGQGAEAPDAELVDSAIILAVFLQQRHFEPPTRTVPGVNGTAILEWQWSDGTTAEIEVSEPYSADVFVMVPGRPAAHLILNRGGPRPESPWGPPAEVAS
jgi:hypothetical protein